jgi:hypothetical protein
VAIDNQNAIVELEKIGSECRRGFISLIEVGARWACSLFTPCKFVVVFFFMIILKFEFMEGKGQSVVGQSSQYPNTMDQKPQGYQDKHLYEMKNIVRVVIRNEDTSGIEFKRINLDIHSRKVKRN